MSRFFMSKIVGQIVGNCNPVPRLIFKPSFLIVIICPFIQIHFTLIVIVIRGDRLRRIIRPEPDPAPLLQRLEALHNVLVFDMRIHVQRIPH